MPLLLRSDELYISLEGKAALKIEEVIITGNQIKRSYYLDDIIINSKTFEDCSSS